MSNDRVMTIAVYRYTPEQNAKPAMQEFILKVSDVRGSMLLNALETLKEQHPDLSFRRSCGEGVCGSDGMNINGRNGLACITPLAELPDRVELRPLPGFPVIRDLVVDMTLFYEQYYKIKPYLQNRDPAPATERLQSPEERARLDGLYECILCACCSSSCPSFWWNPDKFVGPAGLLAASRFISDSRDTETQARLDDLKDRYSVFRCRSIMNCASVCPKSLNPTKAISDIRREMLSDHDSAE
ncbi:MAG: succinate dehydrogenase iron-sulfur subunit [Gammaproteobacteria bacterium RIFCSPHIGHO2_12_FULL_45_9]|nr:MAG: succinate dehydrogenase iron-sulfur subunit [Gammaproteobacteria bacterium RIFCSPHIGHO2_12_FULL_45_9]